MWLNIGVIQNNYTSSDSNATRNLFIIEESIDDVKGKIGHNEAETDRNNRAYSNESIENFELSRHTSLASINFKK